MRKEVVLVLALLAPLMTGCLYSDLNSSTSGGTRATVSATTGKGTGGSLASTNTGTSTTTPATTTPTTGTTAGSGAAGGTTESGSTDPNVALMVDLDNDGVAETSVVDANNNYGSAIDPSLEKTLGFGSLFLNTNGQSVGEYQNAQASGYAAKLTAKIGLAGPLVNVRTLRVYRHATGTKAPNTRNVELSCKVVKNSIELDGVALKNKPKILQYIKYDGLNVDGSLNSDPKKPAPLIPGQYYVYEFCYFDASNRRMAQHSEVFYALDSASPVDNGAGASGQRAKCDDHRFIARVNITINRPDPSITGMTLRYATDRAVNGSDLKFVENPAGNLLSVGNAVSVKYDIHDDLLKGYLAQLRLTGRATVDFKLNAHDKKSTTERNTDGMSAMGEAITKDSKVNIAYEIMFNDSSYKKDSLQELFGENAPLVFSSMNWDTFLEVGSASPADADRNPARFLRGNINNNLEPCY